MGRSIAGLIALAAAGCSAVGHVAHLMPERLARYTRLERSISLPKGPVRYDCGPEALAAVMNYHSIPIGVEQISARIYDTQRKGTLSPLLAPVAREHGLRAEYADGSLERLRDAIARGIPPIVMVRIRDDLFHFFVVSGYSDAEQMILCEDYDGRKRLIPYGDFLARWRDAGWFMLEISPGTAESDFARGADLEARGEYPAAAEWFQRAIEKDAEYQPAWVGLGNCRLLTGETGAAMDAYRRAVELQPNDPRALNNLAHCLIESGDTSDEPRVLAERAVRIYEDRVRRLRDRWSAAPDEERPAIQSRLTAAEIELAYALGTYAEARARSGQPTLAISAWKSSYDLLPLTMYDLRARRLSAIAATYRSLGILSQAREFYEQALRLAQDEQMRAQIREELERIP